MITHHHFAKLKQVDIEVYCLENEYLKVEILNYGATIKSIFYKPLQRETVLGLSSFDDYLTQKFYLGALVGRVANRIDRGRFTLNGINYTLPLNGPHHLHGGPVGFDQRIFNCSIDKDQLLCTLISDDGDQGYPGKVQLELKYSLDDNSLRIDTVAISDQDTLFDTTQHTYFNLNADQSQTILNHTLKLNSQSLFEINQDNCTGHQQLNIDQTCFDFTHPKKIETAMDFNHPQIQRVKGIDHYFIKKQINDPFFARLCLDRLCLSVFSSHDGAHIYTGNYLAPLDKKESIPYLKQNGGICFETQHIPNSINFDLKQAPILRANTPVHSMTIYTYTQGEPNGNQEF